MRSSSYAMDAAPLNELEKRIVVAEALKLSQIPIEKLLDLLREAQTIPLWEHMVLPPGRTMAMCKNAYDVLLRPSQNQAFQPTLHMSESHISAKRKSGAEFYEQRPYVEPVAKKRQSAAEMKVAGRELAPKPSNGSPGPMGAAPGKVPKKRGRPSKADVERTRQEAIAKGVIMAPGPMTMMSPKIASVEYSSYSIAPAPPMATTGTFYDPTQSTTPDRDTSQPISYSRDSPGKMKRKPPPKPKQPLPPGQSSFPILQSVFQSREEHPTAPQYMVTTQHGPAVGPATSIASSMQTAFTISNDPRPPTDPRPET